MAEPPSLPLSPSSPSSPTPALDAVLPADLRLELDSLDSYSFDYSTARFTSYDCWHIRGIHSAVTDIPIMARVSPSQRSLRLEQEYTVVRHLQRVDPSFTHFIRAFEFFHLRKTGAVVSIFEYLGENALVDFSTAMTSTDYVADDNHELSSSLAAAAAPKLVITLPQFLDFAIAAAECLEVLHSAHGMIHGEIRDDAFLYNPESHVVKIIHLGSSTHGAQSRASFSSDSIHDIFVNATLSSKYVYMSPEQTGRASTTIDHRTDIYSLGIVFYSLLTSRLPYYGSAMDIVHQILHSPVPSIESIRPDIPTVINSIIQKMTSKQASNRYRSAGGLRCDLQRVQEMVRSFNDSELLGEEFELGKNDISAVFSLPLDMIGRTAELETVMTVIRKFAKRRSSTHHPGDSNSLSGTRNRASSSSNLGYSETTLSISGTDLSDAESSSTSVSSSRRSNPSMSTSGSTRKQNRHGTEVVAIRGYAGIGKTMLVTALQSGARKYGLYARSTAKPKLRSPFGPLVSLLSNLLQQVLSEKPDVVHSFHNVLRTKLGTQWHKMRRMSSAIPELKLLMEIERRQKAGLNPSQELLQIAEEEPKSASPQWPGEPHASSSLQQGFGSESVGTHSDDATSNAGSSTRHASVNSSMMSIGASSTTAFQHPGEKSGGLPDWLLKNAAGSNMLVASFVLQLFRILADTFNLTIVIGDLHSADDETVEVLQAMIQSRIDMVLIITFRDGSKLPRPMQEFIDSDYSRLTKVMIKPLNRQGVEQYIAQTMHCEPSAITELTGFIYENSKGNPLVLSESLKALHKSGAIRFSTRRRRWVYESMDLVRSAYVDFLATTELDPSFVLRRFRDFPKRTRNFMIWASLLGSPFSYRLVQTLMQMPDGLSSSDSGDSAAAANSGVTLVESDNKAMSSLQTLIQAGIIVPSEESEDSFKFSHARYAQAAQELVRTENLASMNLLLADKLMKDENHSAFFVAEHLLNALPLIRDRPYRRPYRQEFIKAAKEADEMGSLVRAQELFSAAIQLLHPDCWNEDEADVDYNETFDAYYGLAQAYFYGGKPEETYKLVKMLTANIKTRQDRARCDRMVLRVNYLRGEYEATSSMVVPSMLFLGVTTEKEFAGMARTERFWEFYKRIENSTDEELLHPKRTEDPIVVAAEDFLGAAIMVIYMGSPDFFYQTAMLIMHLELNVGSDDNLCRAYIFLAMVAIMKFQMFHFAQKLRRIAHILMPQVADSSIVCRAMYYDVAYLDHIFNHYQNGYSMLSPIFQHAVAAGDRILVLQLQATELKFMFYAFKDLRTVANRAKKVLAETDPAYNMSDAIICIRAIYQTIMALTNKVGSSDPKAILSTDDFDAVAYQEQLLERPITSATVVHLCFYIITLFLYGHFEEIQTVAAKFLLAGENWQTFHCTRESHYAWFFMCLAMVKLLQTDSVSADRREYLLARIKDVQARMEEWAVISDVNHSSWRKTIQMALADLRGDVEEVMVLYEEIVPHCVAHETAIELAVAHLVAGSISIKRKMKIVGGSIMREGITILENCGAVGVVQRFTSLYPEMYSSPRTMAMKSTGVQTTALDGGYLEKSPIDAVENEMAVAEVGEVRRVSRSHTFPLPANVPLEDDERADLHDWQARTDRDVERDQSSMTLDILDLTSIIKSGLVISSEINIDTLLSKMIEIFISTTRAEIAAVITNEDAKIRIAAMGTVTKIESFTAPEKSLESFEKMVFVPPISFVFNTNEPVILGNAIEDDRFAGSRTSWSDAHPEGRSILVYPIRHKNLIVGVLYLEAAPHSFNTRHLEVISLLSQQMGISITNARLFKNIRKATMANAMMIESQNAALKAARESEARFVATLETIPCIIWIADVPDNSGEGGSEVPPLEYLNYFWYKLCGKDAPGPANNAYLQQIHEDDRGVFTSALRNAAGGAYETIEIRIRNEKGEYRWHVCRGTPLKDEDGTITKWIGAMVDIDDQRRAQDDALKAMRLKEEASRMKSEFLANMSHEIRTPIAGVIGMSDLLLSTELLTHQREFADNIRLCADALLSVITDVLDFSKIEVGKLELSMEAFDVETVLKETLSILSFPAAKKGLRLVDEIRFSKTPMPLVIGDAGRFRQIAMNLLTNAVKFSRQGQITLMARDGVETTETIEVNVRISDTGIGISKPVLSKLFVPFQQGDNSTARQFGGTGLGLSISKNLVELMNGTIRLESEYGKGTVASFTVPFRKAPPEAIAAAEAAVGEGGGRSRQCSEGGRKSGDVVSWESGGFAHCAEMPPTPGSSGPITPPSEYPLSSTTAGVDYQRPRGSVSSIATSTYSSSPTLVSPLLISRASNTSAISDAESISSNATAAVDNGAAWILVVEDNLINQQIALNILKRLKFNVEAVGNGQEALIALDRRVANGQYFELILMDCQMPLMDGYGMFPSLYFLIRSEELD
ncbi:hypothetical protein BZA70DRAFT_277803 [Myxozyma melibiosi]|uniref:Serine/threonine protein kinase n=1 Tax=Myxozyma melibiosi TaxID=54550 RepID=A0ABR1F637_9ASCO